MKQIQQTPDAMVINGVTRFGHFRTPFRKINLADAKIPGMPRALRAVRLKEWTHVGLIHPEAYFGFVINTCHYLGMSFAYMFDRASGEYFEHERISPLAMNVKLAETLWDDMSYFRLPGHRIDNHNLLEEGRFDFDIDVKKKDGAPAMKGKVSLFEDAAEMQPLIVSLPLGANRTMYSHKAALPVEGSLNFGGREFGFERGRDIGIIDVHKAYYPYNTWWRWATCAGYDAEGRLVGINLTKNLLVGDPDKNNENGLWVGGRLSLLGGVSIEFDEKDVLKPWRMKTRDGRADLVFKPEGERHGKVNAGPIMSDYHQPFGTFSGFAIDDDGTRHEFNDYYGVTEYHVTRW